MWAGMAGITKGRGVISQNNPRSSPGHDSGQALKSVLDLIEDITRNPG